MKIQGMNTTSYIQNADLNSIQNRTKTAKTYTPASDKAIKLSISEEGQESLRNSLIELGYEAMELMEPSEYHIRTHFDDSVVKEHYTAMRDMYKPYLEAIKEGKGSYDVNDVAGAIMGAYEELYNQIVQGHEDGTRQIYLDSIEAEDGKRKMTLEEDLAYLDKAFEKNLANMEGFIYCRQSKNFQLTPPNVQAVIDGRPTEYDDMDADIFDDKEYRDTAISLMKQARDEFIDLFKNKIGYTPGIAKDLISNLFSKNADFVLKTQTLFT